VTEFGSEASMAAPVEAWLRESGGSCVGHEVAVGYGIPDLVAGFGAVARVRNRRRQAHPITRRLQLAVLVYCETVRTEDELRAWAPNGYSSLRREAIDPLVSDGLMVVAGQRFRTRVSPKDPFDKIVAVELKLRDHGRGFAQAFAYRTFADRSYLALPTSRVRAPMLGRAREIGVGLLAVSPDSVDELVEPSMNSLVTPGRRRMASELVLEAAIDSNRPRAGSPSPSLAF